MSNRQRYVNALISYDEEGFVQLQDPTDATRNFRIPGSQITADQLRRFTYEVITQVLDNLNHDYILERTHLQRSDPERDPEIYADDLVNDLFVPFEARQKRKPS